MTSSWPHASQLTSHVPYTCLCSIPSLQFDKPEEALEELGRLVKEKTTGKDKYELSQLAR